MFKNFRINTLLLFIPLTALMFCFNSPQNEDEKMQTIMVSVKNTLSYLHYSPKKIDDQYSKAVYKKYMETLDPMKRYFLKSDMDEFKTHEDKLDNYLNDGDLTFFNLTNDRMLKRADEIQKLTADILSKPINLDEDEQLLLESKLRKSPKNMKEMRKVWKQFIKYNILQEMEILKSREKAKKKEKDSLQKNGLKDTINLKILTPTQKLEKATKEVKYIINDSFRLMKKRKKMKSFANYMNVYAETFDPHTNYFSPQGKEDFDANFKGKIIGIGAVIKYEKGYLYIGTLTVGAPAWKSGELKDGDKILKVRSKPNEEPINVVGMLPSEAVPFIRGEKGVPVTLTVQKNDGTVKEVTMKREEVEIEDTFARSLIIEDKGKKYGYINLPGFNSDFDEENKRNASDDVKAEIIKLKKQNIDGIILDLRNNGGGSLTEVGDMMGLFMKKGAYVQVKDGNGKVKTYRQRENNPIWDGKLVVMQNELSASASEIFSGLIQDYGRGVVIGSPQSFGKGTVQTFVGLNRFLNTEEDFGALKLTIQKFYRVTGESTQRNGVASDIVMKDYFSFSDIGERFEDEALAWDKVSSSDFTPVNQVDVEALKIKSANRIANDANYQMLLKAAKWKENLDKEESITLNQAQFFDLMDKREKQLDEFDKLKKFKNGLSFTIHADEEAREKNEKEFKKKTENWLKNLNRDIYLKEAVNVISDMK